MIEIQILFVVETNPVVKSDDAYYSWIMKNFYRDYVSALGFDNIRISFSFIHMDGKTNYNSENVKKDISYATNVFLGDKTFVVFCLDMDSKSSSNCKFVGDMDEFCKSRGYCLSVAYKEIEDVLNVPSGSSKSDRVKLFARHLPKKDDYAEKNFYIAVDNLGTIVGQTNFKLVIDSIIERAKRIKK